MDEEFNLGMFVAAVLGVLIAGVIGLIVHFHGVANRISHEKLGSLGNACFANKTCRSNFKCVNDGSESGICVK